MDTRIWAIVAVVLVFGGFAGFTDYFSKLDAAQHKLAKARDELRSLEEEFGENVYDAEKARAEAEATNQLVAVYTHLEEQKKPLAESVLALEGQKEATLKVFREAVDEVRSKAVGIQWADIPYRNGQTLRGVRIQKVNENDVTLAHNDGVTKLGVDEMPAELKERFRFGMEPFLNVPAPPATEMTPGAPAVLATATKLPGAQVSEVETAVATLRQLENALSASTSKVRETEASWSQWKIRGSTFQDQAFRAKGSGRPSYTFNTQAAEAQKQADALSRQLVVLRAENTKLHENLSSARMALARAESEQRKAEAQAKAKARADARAAKSAKTD
ncbi:MAG: hypothetical protein ACAH88_06380 [Roseimicrobium sp.]